MKTILVDAVYCLVIEEDGKFSVFEDMRKLLDAYENPKIVLTGANDEQWQKFNLSNVPYQVFTLKHNPEKTDFKYYNILLAKFNLSPKDVVYFEHSPEAVKSAQSIDINTYFYDDDKKDLISLKKFLDENL
jgi:FMN phosphatase YigB (HAD superfamily)